MVKQAQLRQTGKKGLRALCESGRSTYGGNVIGFMMFSNPVHSYVKCWRVYASLKEDLTCLKKEGA